MNLMIRRQHGMVLVLALWVLSILAAFALSMGVSIRQKAMLVSRIEKREALHFIAQNGVQKARIALIDFFHKVKDRQTAEAKVYQYNNPEIFRSIAVDDGAADVFYENYDLGVEEPLVLYGVEDEERKLNINTASQQELKRLFIIALGFTEEMATDLANAIVDWRTELDQSIVGFYGEQYYQRLTFSYEPKKAPFEKLEELLLVKGMNQPLYDYIKRFLTIYGDGRVNINTAPKAVLFALGLSAEVIDLIVSARHGPDGFPATPDDFIFTDRGSSIDIGGLSLSPEQLAQIDWLYVHQKIATASHFFRIRSQASLVGAEEKRTIDCVMAAHDGRILSWREQ